MNNQGYTSDISVIIPSYKPGDYLWKCLDSLCNQSLASNRFEVILVLNGCKEPYETEINKYIGRHQSLNFRYIQVDQGGVSHARNIGIDNARGEYITFIDDDDYVSPRYLEELFGKADKDCIALCYPYAFIDGSSTQQPYRITATYDACSQKGRQPFSSSVRRCFSGPCMKLIPRAYIGDRRFDCRFANGEDGLFMFLISDRYKFVTFTSREAVYYRRIRLNSATTTKRRLGYYINNGLSLMCQFSRIYFSHPFRYRGWYYLTHFFGSFRMILWKLLGCSVKCT